MAPKRCPEMRERIFRIADTYIEAHPIRNIKKKQREKRAKRVRQQVTQIIKSNNGYESDDVIKEIEEKHSYEPKTQKNKTKVENTVTIGNPENIFNTAKMNEEEKQIRVNESMYDSDEMGEEETTEEKRREAESSVSQVDQERCNRLLDKYMDAYATHRFMVPKESNKKKNKIRKSRTLVYLMMKDGYESDEIFEELKRKHRKGRIVETIMETSAARHWQRKNRWTRTNVARHVKALCKEYANDEEVISRINIDEVNHKKIKKEERKQPPTQTPFDWTTY